MDLEKQMLFTEDRDIESAYIINMGRNKESNRLAARCAETCVVRGQKYEMWDAFDGTGDSLLIPERLKNQEYIGWLKKPNDKYSLSQIACFLSHYSLWGHCATINKPIIILEHDAVCVKPLYEHRYYNCIQYLGSREQYNGAPVLSIPPHASIYNGHWRSLCRAHAYAIDPAMARNLLSYAIREGMTKTLDIFIRCDIFAIVQDGLHFYDSPGISTINELEDYSEDA